MIIEFTKEEAKEVLSCLEQCRVEYGGGTELYEAIHKVKEALKDDN